MLTKRKRQKKKKKKKRKEEEEEETGGEGRKELVDDVRKRHVYVGFVVVACLVAFRKNSF